MPDVAGRHADSKDPRPAHAVSTGVAGIPPQQDIWRQPPAALAGTADAGLSRVAGARPISTATAVASPASDATGAPPEPVGVTTVKAGVQPQDSLAVKASVQPQGGLAVAAVLAPGPEVELVTPASHSSAITLATAAPTPAGMRPPVASAAQVSVSSLRLATAPEDARLPPTAAVQAAPTPPAPEPTAVGAVRAGPSTSGSASHGGAAAVSPSSADTPALPQTPAALTADPPSASQPMLPPRGTAPASGVHAPDPTGASGPVDLRASADTGLLPSATWQMAERGDKPDAAVSHVTTAVAAQPGMTRAPSEARTHAAGTTGADLQASPIREQAAVNASVAPPADTPAPAAPAGAKPVAPVASGEALVPSPAAQAAAPLIALASTRTSQTTILRLDPGELGHLDIRIERSASGSTAVHMTAEKPETLALLVRDEAQLHRALDQAGVPAQGRSVTFHLTTADAANPPAGLASPAPASHSIATASSGAPTSLAPDGRSDSATSGADARGASQGGSGGGNSGDGTSGSGGQRQPGSGRPSAWPFSNSNQQATAAREHRVVAGIDITA